MKFAALFVSCCLLFSMNAFAEGEIVPVVNDDPVTNQTLERDMFDFIAQTLGSGKMASHMACSLKTRVGREQRKFSSGSEWVEYIQVDFNSTGFEGGKKTSFKIPMGANYGVKKTNNQWSAVGEDIKIELGDTYGHWIRFAHDGQGRLIMLQLGNDLAVNPCSRH
jgi:hypothetical protein